MPRKDSVGPRWLPSAVWLYTTSRITSMPAAWKLRTMDLNSATLDVRLAAYCLAGLACVAARNEDTATAGRLWTLAERLEHEIGFRMVAAERVRYERNLTPALTNTDEYRAGIADAANIDPLTAAAEIVNP